MAWGTPARAAPARRLYVLGILSLHSHPQVPTFPRHRTRTAARMPTEGSALEGDRRVTGVVIGSGWAWRTEKSAEGALARTLSPLKTP